MTAGALLLCPSRVEGAGTGHLARCYALAEAWKATGGTAVVRAPIVAGPWDERFASIGVEVVAAAPASSFDWVALDGYEYTIDDHRAARDLAERVLVIDDHCSAGAYDADLVVDQNASAKPEAYPSGTPLLAGPRYALLRAEIRTARPAEPRVAEAARRIAFLSGGTPSPSLQQFVDELTDAEPVRGFEAVAFADPRSFAATLATADLVVSAAGTSALEICCLGLPSVLFSVAGNQRPVAAALAAAGAALDAGDVSALSAPSLAGNVAALARDAGRLGELATQAWRLVDGEGVMRLLARMRTAVVRLRPATSADARSLFEWRTDELTQRWSFSDDAIEWEHHVAWLERTLADAGTKLFIAEDRAGAAVGQVRFDLDPASNRAEVSIGLAAAARGSGLGAAIVAAGVDDLFESTPVTTVVARIKPGNTASINTFVRADFDDAGVEGSGGREVLLYSRQRDAART